MKKTHQKYTKLVGIEQDDMFLYYLDEQESTIDDFFRVIDAGYHKATQRQYRLFKGFKPFNVDIELHIGLN